MDIKVERDVTEGKNYFESYAREQLQKYFNHYPFLESINVFFRGTKHPTKKVKFKARLKGKDVFVEASGVTHDVAIDAAGVKLKAQMEKHKDRLYRKAS